MLSYSDETVSWLIYYVSFKVSFLMNEYIHIHIQMKNTHRAEIYRQEGCMYLMAIQPSSPASVLDKAVHLRSCIGIGIGNERHKVPVYTHS